VIVLAIRCDLQIDAMKNTVIVKTRCCLGVEVGYEACSGISRRSVPARSVFNVRIACQAFQRHFKVQTVCFLSIYKPLECYDFVKRCCFMKFVAYVLQ
jgi:hypothetical protein